MRNRRLGKDDERRVQTSETLIEVAATRLVLRRLARHMTRTAERHPCPRSPSSRLSGAPCREAIAKHALSGYPRGSTPLSSGAKVASAC
jgi:hypothetical protein